MSTVTEDHCACCRICAFDPAERHTEAESVHHEDHGGDSGHGDDSSHGDHSGHEQTFRRKFWVCLPLSVPVLYWSASIQGWFGYTAPVFPGSTLIVPVVATYIFFYGGSPFLRMAGWEMRSRKPGMMMLIALAITVAYVFSMATLVWSGFGEDFFWELVTLIDIMLLGHWMEMRSVRLASGRSTPSRHSCQMRPRWSLRPARSRDGRPTN